LPISPRKTISMRLRLTDDIAARAHDHREIMILTKLKL